MYIIVVSFLSQFWIIWFGFNYRSFSGLDARYLSFFFSLLRSNTWQLSPLLVSCHDCIQNNSFDYRQAITACDLAAMDRGIFSLCYTSLQHTDNTEFYSKLQISVFIELLSCRKLAKIMFIQYIITKQLRKSKCKIKNFLLVITKNEWFQDVAA